MSVSSYVDSRFAIVVKGGDEIYHIWRNKISEFLTLCQCINVMEEKFGRGENFRKEVLSESSHRIERHIDVVKEVLDIQSCVSFESCLYDEIMEFW